MTRLLDALLLACLPLAIACTAPAEDSDSELGTTAMAATESETTSEPTDTTAATTVGDSSHGATSTDSGANTSVVDSSSSGDHPGSSGDDTSSTGATGLFSASGVTTRSVEPGQGNDGIGTLYYAVVDNCGLSFRLIAMSSVPGADTSAPVPYTVPDIPPGTWHMLVFLDDNDNAELPEPAPDSGDLVVSEGAGLGCTEFTIDGEDIDGVDLNLNFALL